MQKQCIKNDRFQITNTKSNLTFSCSSAELGSYAFKELWHRKFWSSGCECTVIFAELLLTNASYFSLVMLQTTDEL